ncbi:MAG: sensor histidine kinase N-terminal domain-containing protein, partial [Paracoccaceae bacterium]
MIRAPKQAGSLRINLLFWLFGPVAAILCLSLWLSFTSAMRHATLVMDGQLMSSARMIAEQTRFRQGAIRVVMPPAALELFADGNHDEIAYAVFAADGTLIAGFPGLALPEPLTQALVPKSFPTKFRTEDMHAVVVQQS